MRLPACLPLLQAPGQGLYEVYSFILLPLPLCLGPEEVFFLYLLVDKSQRRLQRTGFVRNEWMPEGRLSVDSVSVLEFVL